MTTAIDKATLIDWLGDGAELAILDIRPPEEVGPYGLPLVATNLPAERLDAELDRFVPRRGVRTVLVDAGDGAARQAVDRLSARGWTGLRHLEGGIPAWTDGGADGLPTFDTLGVVFSGRIRDEKHTPVVTADELKAARDAGEDVVVLDSRTLPEFAANHVPGAIGVPGAELLLRFADVVPSPATRVVVSCAGLPRAIIGAQTLIDAGVPNPVAYLHDGTRGWTEAGLALEEGAHAVFGPPSDRARAFARDHLARLAADDSFPLIDPATAASWSRDPDRTTYLLDVRTPDEFAASHLPGAISSEGGQLLGLAIRTIAVRGARVVLIDDQLGVRARTVAHWLQRRGYEIALLLHDFAGEARESTPEVSLATQ